MVLTVVTPLEISQWQIFDKVVDMPVVVQQPVHDHKNSGVNSFQCQSTSVVAVHQGRRHPCRGAGADPCGPRHSEDVSNSTATGTSTRSSMSHVVQVEQVPQEQVVETIEFANRWKIVEIPENSHFMASRPVRVERHV